MSGFLERLIDRGVGGERAMALPLVRPVAGLYAPPPSAGLAAGAHEEVREETFAPAAASGPAPIREAGRGAPVRRAAGIEARRVEAAIRPVAEGRAAAQRTAEVRSPAAPAPDAMERAAGMPPLRAATVDGMRAGAGGILRPAASGAAPPRATPTPAAPASALGAAAEPPPMHARAPVTPDDIAKAIFATPPAQRRAGPEARPVMPQPVVSIGRIDIEVAAPPAPAPAPRTHGFGSYARLRRGLER